MANEAQTKNSSVPGSKVCMLKYIDVNLVIGTKKLSYLNTAVKVNLIVCNQLKYFYFYFCSYYFH